MEKQVTIFYLIAAVWFSFMALGGLFGFIEPTALLFSITSVAAASAYMSLYVIVGNMWKRK